MNSDIGFARLVETHEHFHKLLDDSTAFGSLTAIVAELSFNAEGSLGGYC